MPHLRPRFLEKQIIKDLTWAPVVSVLGMRQIGKSTLLNQLGNTYLTLDDDAVLRGIETGDWSTLESSRPPVVLDEAQKSPGLFDRVKLLVDRRKRPGQFLLTGSVRFLSRKQIRESLTGRTSLLELLPMTLAEAHSKPLFDFVGTLARTDIKNSEATLEAVTRRSHFSASDAESYLELGGMPGICFKRNKTIRKRMREAHLETLLLRDLQLLVKTTIPFSKLLGLLTSLAQMSPSGISAAALGRQVQLSTPTVIQMLRAFEDLFILRSLGKKWYFCDVGMGTYLGAGRIENPLFHMERFVYQELYAQLVYGHKAEFDFQSYLSRGGAWVPFVIRLGTSRLLAITVDASDGASEKSLKGLSSFSKKQRSPVTCVVLHRGQKSYLSSTGAFCFPYHWIV